MKYLHTSLGINYWKLINDSYRNLILPTDVSDFLAAFCVDMRIDIHSVVCHVFVRELIEFPSVFS